MNKNVYKATFPLHEGRYDKDGPQGEKSDRRVGFGFAYSKINSAPSLAIVPGMGSLEELL